MEKIELVCPITKQKLNYDEVKNCYSSESATYYIKNNIPRFVESENYADSFGHQWKKFSKTQLDSFTNTTISRDRLLRMFGGNFDLLKGKTVLEIGCGAGRFTEIMLKEGARVFAVDLSNAVEANFDNCHTFQNYSVYQANIYSLPFMPESFDIVVCVGVVQHTPNSEKTMETLCSYLKKGGTLVMDHYSKKYPFSISRRILRYYLLKKKQPYPLNFVSKMTKLFWPMHLFFNRIKKKSFFGYLLWGVFYKLSPVVDYQDSYPQLGDKLLFEWAILDTHDTLTDYYKHLRTLDQIKTFLLQCNLTDIQISEGGNGIEVLAKK